MATTMNIATLFPLCINYGPLSKTPPESLYRNNTGIVRLLNNPDFKPRVKHPRALRTRRPQHAVDHPAEGTGRNVGARSAAQPTSRDSAPTREALMHSEGAGSFAATPTPLSSEDASRTTAISRSTSHSHKTRWTLDDRPGFTNAASSPRCTTFSVSRSHLDLVADRRGESDEKPTRPRNRTDNSRSK